MRQNSRAFGSFIGKDVIVGLGAVVAREGSAGGEAAAPKVASAAIPDSNPTPGFYLGQSYPNPFNPDTWIPYGLREDADVTIEIHSVSGQLVRRLDLGHRASGSYVDKAEAAHWDGTNESGESVASGIYFYTFHAGEYAATRKMLILR
jgi:hypothetical protein